MRRPRSLEPAELSGLRAPWAIVDAHVWTGDGGRHEAIAFGADGRVLACGHNRAVTAALPRGAEIVDGRGATVCPGFVDPHVHVRAAASASLGIDASRAAGPADILTVVRDACRERGDARGGSRDARGVRRDPRDGRGDAAAARRDWVTVVGADLGSPLAGQAPDRVAVDRVSGATPVRIRDRSGHAWLFNSAALATLGVDPAGAAPAGVMVERDADRSPTGFVADHVGWVGSRLGRVTDGASLTEAVGRWSRRMARVGVVALCDATATNGAAQARSLVRWRRCGALRQEISFLSAPTARIDAHDRHRHAGVKFADPTDPALRDALRRAARTGLRVAVHAVTPEDVGAVLGAVRAQASMLRLEHAGFVPPDWIGAVRALGATVVTHPGLIETRGDAYLADEELRPHDWLYRLRSWTDHGVPLAFASDAPFGPADPLAALRAAAHRRTAGGALIGPREALAGEDALRALTVRAADCSGLGPLGYGRIRRGGPGAAVVLSHDPRDPLQLDELRLLATVIDGDVVD